MALAAGNPGDHQVEASMRAGMNQREFVVQVARYAWRELCRLLEAAEGALPGAAVLR